MRRRSAIIFPEAPEVPLLGASETGQAGAPPGCRPATEPVPWCPPSRQQLLSPAEGLPELMALRSTSSSVRAELEGAAVGAAGPCIAGPWSGDAECRQQ